MISCANQSEIDFIASVQWSKSKILKPVGLEEWYKEKRQDCCHHSPQSSVIPLSQNQEVTQVRYSSHSTVIQVEQTKTI